MRPALTRLLNRPSSIHIVESLVTSPARTSQLSSGLNPKCLHCQAHRLRRDIPTASSSKSLGGPAYQNRRHISSEKKSKGRDIRPLPLEPLQAGQRDSRVTLDVNCPSGPDLGKRRNKPIKKSSSPGSGAIPDTSSRTRPINEEETYELWTVDPQRLEFESQVSYGEGGTRLVDQRDRRHDFALWEELLRYRQRHYGDDGTIEIWKGFMARKQDIPLPVDGYYADIFWQSFVDLGLRREDFLHEVQQYAQDRWNSSGGRWANFYESVVGGFFQQGLEVKALNWHRLLKDTHLAQPNDILTVFRQASSTPEGLNAFRHICKTTDGHQIYSSVVPTLYKQNRLQDTLRMHKFLVHRKDAPSRLQDVEPLLEYVQRYRSKEVNEDFRAQLVVAGILKEEEPPEYSVKQGDIETSVVKPPRIADGTDQKKIQDRFGARLFATKALTFDLILAGLRMFGVEAIGPLTLREMAVRAKDAKDVDAKIHQLHMAEISIGDSVFARIVKKLAGENDETLLQDILHNDQHPDVLEDWRIQESLLASYYIAGDWRQFDRTVAILKAISHEDSGSYNLLFRNSLNVGNLTAASRLVEEMRQNNVPLTDKSRFWMFHRMIRRRKRSQRPLNDPESFADLTYVVGIWQYFVEAGGQVPPEAWRESLKRLGMTERWDELRKLSLWLAYWYSPESDADRDISWNSISAAPLSQPLRSDGHELHPSHQQSPLRIIFPPVVLQAIVAWGFKKRPSADHKGKPYPNPFYEGGDTLIPWMRGLVLVRELRDKGLLVQRGLVAKACRQRLAVLYGEVRPSNRPINRVLRAENPWTLDEVLADIRIVWGKPLFDDKDELYDRHRLVNPRTQRPAAKWMQKKAWNKELGKRLSKQKDDDFPW